MEEDDEIQIDLAQFREVGKDDQEMVCDIMKCIGVDKESGRPSTALILIFPLAMFMAGILLLPLGVRSLYLMKHEIQTSLNVTGYVVQKLVCPGSGQNEPWTAFIKGEYIVGSGYIYKDKSYYVCGSYQETALEHAITRYPLGSNLTIWYWDDEPSYITSRDPSAGMPFLWCFVGSVIILTVVVVAHMIAVLFFGFHALVGGCCLCRARYPYASLYY